MNDDERANVNRYDHSPEAAAPDAGGAGLDPAPDASPNDRVETNFTPPVSANSADQPNEGAVGNGIDSLPPFEPGGVRTPDVVFAFACPECRGALERTGLDELICSRDSLVFRCVDGIWRLMTAERLEQYAQFLREYDIVRQAEGRGSDDPAYYRALPYEDHGGALGADWKIRARSYETLIERVIEPLELRAGRSLAILDLGAGNGWLSNRLAAREHRVAAVDLRVDPLDGLGAHAHYETGFVPVQAEFDRLPFAGGQFDLVIFNAALHYSADYQVTLKEALRVLGDDGHIVIIDSPVYRDPESGRAMVREREADFVARFGFPSNARPAENFLTHDRLRELGETLGVRWRLHEPFYGLEWALRPWRAKLRRRREPARFYVIDGRRQPAPPAGEPGRVKRAAGRFLTRWRYRLTQRGRYRQLALEEVAGYPLVILPDVFNPAIFRTGAFLAEALNGELIPPGSTVLDLGCGSGIVGIAAARWAGRVVAVDINPEAVRCTRINALLNRVDDRLVARQGDLFEPAGVEQFDVVLFNPPYFRGAPTDLHDYAWRSEDAVERFAAELAGHLKPGGYALVVLSTDGESPAFLDAFQANGLGVSVAARRELLNETLTVYRLIAKE